ncbi:MAG: hypothetical protein JW862_03585 [Anaerolineales bacterium]|nr:hypothetical protein [Anaerolineales bacterium]
MVSADTHLACSSASATWWADFSQADLQGATIPDGSRYDGRFNLAGDLANARSANLDPNNPVKTADFYGVALSEYLVDQDWMRVHPTQPWFEMSLPDNQADVDAVVSKFFALERPGVLPG